MISLKQTPKVAQKSFLIGVFVVAFLFGTEPNKAMAAVVPFSTEDASAAHPAIIFIDDCPSEIAFAEHRRLTFKSDASAIWKHDCKPDVSGQIASQITGFAGGKNNAPEIIMTERAQRTDGRSIRNKLAENPTFDDCRVRIAGIDQHVENLPPFQMNIAQNDRGRCVEINSARARSMLLRMSRAWQ